MSGGDEPAGMFAALQAENTRLKEELKAAASVRADLDAESGALELENTRHTEEREAVRAQVRAALDAWMEASRTGNPTKKRKLYEAHNKAMRAALALLAAPVTSDKQAIRHPPRTTADVIHPPVTDFAQALRDALAKPTDLRTTADEYAAAHDLADPSRAE